MTWPFYDVRIWRQYDVISTLMCPLGSWTVDSEVYIVHICHVILAYTLESVSSLTQITHNLQATINLKKKGIKKEQQKSEGTH